MKLVYSSYDMGEAAFLISLLEAEGIENKLWDNQGKGNTIAFQLWVLKDSDLERASEIIKEYDQTQATPSSGHGGWKCPGCGEDHQASFSECWKCGQPRPA